MNSSWKFANGEAYFRCEEDELKLLSFTKNRGFKRERKQFYEIEEKLEGNAECLFNIELIPPDV